MTPPDGTLKTADESELAARIREAMGADPDEEILVSTPQFERTDGVEIDWFPDSKMDIYGLAALGEDQLRDLGLQKWKDDLWLLPADWYLHIPEGTLLKDITGEVIEFEPGETSDDRRHGALAYGIERGDPDGA